MKTEVHDSKDHLGRAAAARGATAIRAAIASRGQAAIIVATGASQFDTLAHLVQEDIDWSKVTAFHLDEYVGIAPDHPASFRRYLRERFVGKLPDLQRFVFIDGDAADLGSEVRRISDLIAGFDIDVCFAGIGENGHLAFNDPPADFDTDAPFIVVELDLACRRQQMGEGWFASLDEVPGQAISMSIRQIMKSRQLVLSVPDARKAPVVKASLEGPVTVDMPASIIQRHPDTWLYLDRPSAALLSGAAK